MTDLELRNIVRQSLDMLINVDLWLLEKDLSERSITHKLAEHIQGIVGGNYNVDCEYNGDIEGDGDRKHIDVLKSELEGNGLLRPKEGEREEDVISRSVFPDIIIHKRGQNAPHNKCIIEVKKSTNPTGDLYDCIKLSAYTSDRFDNHLKYQIGLFIEIVTGNNNPTYIIRYFQNGEERGEPTE